MICAIKPKAVLFTIIYCNWLTKQLNWYLTAFYKVTKFIVFLFILNENAGGPSYIEITANFENGFCGFWVQYIAYDFCSASQTV